jgi:hypothetical protein
MLLNMPELLVNLVLHDFSEKTNLSILISKCL